MPQSRRQYLETRIEQLQDAMQAAEPGVVSVGLRDGSRVAYSDISSLENELRKLQAELVRLKNGNARPVNLGGR